MNSKICLVLLALVCAATAAEYQSKTMQTVSSSLDMITGGLKVQKMITEKEWTHVPQMVKELLDGKMWSMMGVPKMTWNQAKDKYVAVRGMVFNIVKNYVKAKLEKL